MYTIYKSSIFALTSTLHSQPTKYINLLFTENIFRHEMFQSLNSAKWHLQNLNYWCLFHEGNSLWPKYLSQYSTLSTNQFSALFAFSIDFEPCYNLLHINVIYHVSLDTLKLDKSWHCHCILSMSSKYI